MDKIYNLMDTIPQDSHPIPRGSINEKFFSWILSYGLEVYGNSTKINELRSIDIATGKNLDAIGTNYGEPRLEADDQFYRFMLKSKILAAQSKGTTNDIINVISKSLSVDPTQISIETDRVYVNDVNGNNGEFFGTPYKVSVRKLPLSFTTNDFQKKFLIKRIEDSVAEGIMVGDISFTDYSKASIFVGSAQSVTIRHSEVVKVDI